MNQIKWKYINSCSFEIIRADFMRTLWNEYAPNPAYPEEDTIDETEESPENVITSTLTFGGGDYRRGISGYVYENLELTDRKSLQAIFWERTCDLLDSIHTFTIGFNNDFWHEPPNYDEDNDDMDEELPWDEYYEQTNSDMVSLEEDIVDLARKVSKAQKESEQVSYDRIIDFINSKDDYLNIEWADIESWKEAKKCLLSQMEKYFVAVGPDPFLSSYIDEYLPKQQQEHFDWRINPILRDVFLGFLTRNLFLVDINKKLLEDTQLTDLLFEDEDSSFQALYINDFNGKDVLSIEDYDHKGSFMEWKYEKSYFKGHGGEDVSYKEYVEFFKKNLGSNFVEDI